MSLEYIAVPAWLLKPVGRLQCSPVVDTLVLDSSRQLQQLVCKESFQALNSAIKTNTSCSILKWEKIKKKQKKQQLQKNKLKSITKLKEN